MIADVDEKTLHKRLTDKDITTTGHHTAFSNEHVFVYSITYYLYCQILPNALEIYLIIFAVGLLSH